MTLTVTLNEREDGTWFARCDEHAAWRCEAPTCDELKAKVPKSLKSHHSRNLQFSWWLNGRANV